MKTILVPLDGSQLAEQVLPYVRMLAPLLGANVRLLRVVSDTGRNTVTAEALNTVSAIDATSIARRERGGHDWGAPARQAEEYLASQATHLRENGPDVDVEVRVGSPADVIAKAVHEQTVLIAMATHGYGGLRRWALGSVADKVIRTVTVPVFLVRSTAGLPAKVTDLKRILVPLDGSSLARQALPFAQALAIETHGELVLLNAVPPVPGLHLGPYILPIDVEIAQREQSMQVLGHLADHLRSAELRTISVVQVGSPAEVIVDEAARLNVDLIIMATHGYSGVRRWALGSMSDKVLHAANVPLVLMRGVNGSAGNTIIGA